MTIRTAGEHKSEIERRQAAQRRLVLALGAYQNSVQAAQQRLTRVIRRDSDEAGSEFVTELLRGSA